MNIKTQLEQAKEELKEVKQDITEVEENRLLVESVKDYGIFFIDPNGYVTRWNVGIEQIKLYKPEEVLGKHFRMFYTDEDIEKGWPEHNLKEALTHGRYEEVRLRLRKGKLPFWGDVAIVPLHNEQNELLGFAKIIKDITEHKQWEERLEQSNKNLAHFATMAAHDLQNPLRKLEKFSAHLRKSAEGKLNEEEVDVLRRMQQSIIQMQNLVRDLLELSHVGSQVQQFMPVKLADIVNEVIFGLQDTINETNGRVEIGEMIELDANPAQLRQLLENLIGNGLKYHKKDEPPVVRVAAQKTDETYCQIQVQDQGIGFNPEQAEKIFEIFERLHGNGTYPGTGIGLAICEKIAERHGGNIRAHGIPGEGASFIVDLPLTQPLAK